MKCLTLRLALLLRIKIEVEVHQLLSAHNARAAVAEVEFFEQLDRRLALDECVQRDLEIGVIVAEFEGRLHQLAADSFAAHVRADAKAADFANAGLMMLHADHPDDLSRAAVA